MAPLILLAGFLAIAQPQLPAQRTELQTAAKAFVDLLHKGDFDAAVKDFDATMAKAMPPAQLKATWQTVGTQAGAYQRQLGVRNEQVGKYIVIVVTCQFEKAKLDTRVVFDRENHIAGLQIVPAVDYKPPAYARRESFQEQEVTVGTGEWTLPGTLALPIGDGPFPAVVLVHGSGPHDRDETIGPNKTFRDLAWGLASRGIAVLRYEKRTKRYTDKFISPKDRPFTAKDEVDDDALAAVQLLRTTKGVDPKRIYVLGHSLGATMAPRIGSRDKDIAGLILLAGTTRPLEDVTLEQLSYIETLDPQNEVQRSEIAKLKTQVTRLKDPQLSGTEIIMGAPASYWRELRDYHPAEVAATLKQRLLILQGERDYQVTMVDFAGWQKALDGHKNATFKSYPALNHLFADGVGKAKPAEYMVPGHVAEGVISDIAEWVKKQ
jgi:dienelactone hydrolase